MNHPWRLGFIPILLVLFLPTIGLAEDPVPARTANVDEGPGGPEPSRPPARTANVDEGPGGPEPSRPPAKVLTAHEFISSQGAQHFMAEEYDRAITAFEEMKQDFPDNILILRYQGIAYYQIGRYEEAVSNFLEGIQLVPDNVATYYYLAEAYFALKRYPESEKALEWVVENDADGRYKDLSAGRMQELKPLMAIQAPPALPPREAPPVPAPLPAPEGPPKVLPSILIEEKPKFEISPKPKRKNWEIEIGSGYEYDDNATFNSRDPRISETKDRNAGRYKNSLTGSYKFLRREGWIGKAKYEYATTLYDDGLDHLNTYTQTASVSITRITELFERPLILRLGDSFKHTIREAKSFVYSNAVNSIVIYEPVDRVQILKLFTFQRNEYQDPTTNPDRSSRDGFSYSLVLLNTLYFNEAETVYFTLGYEYKHDDANGRNFIQDVNGGRAEIHFPVVWRWEFDFSARYTHDDRPEYEVVTADGTRRDDIWELTPALEKTLGKNENMKLKFFYSYNRASSRNNNFEYRRNYGGIEFTIEF